MFTFFGERSRGLSAYYEEKYFFTVKNEKPIVVAVTMFPGVASSFKAKMSLFETEGKRYAILTSAAKSTNSCEYHELWSQSELAKTDIGCSDKYQDHLHIEPALTFRFCSYS